MAQISADERRGTAVDEAQAPAPSGLGGRASGWEDVLTLLIAGAAFVAVAANVQASHWVAGVPPLYLFGPAALLVAYGLARMRQNQLLLVFAGLFLGATIVFFQLIAIVPGETIDTRAVALVARMHHWWYAITHHGSSRDGLPIIVIMLALTWVGAFSAAWAICRWKNAVLGLVPGAAALAWDAAFSTGGFSVSAVLYIILGTLLFIRLRVLREQARWQRERTPYPRFIVMPALLATLCATVALLIAAWLAPSGAESRAANAEWGTLTSPLTSHLAPIAGAFVAINPDKGVKIHALKDALLLSGAITLSDLPAGSVSVDLPPDVAPFVRAESFEQYGRNGWQVNGQSEQPLAAGVAADVQDPRDGTLPILRKPVELTVTVAGGNGDRLLSIGQPLKSNRTASAATGGGRPDVSSIDPSNHLGNGTRYTVIGSASAATAGQLRNAGTDYPSWVTQRYLQLPSRMAGRVSRQAHQIVADTTNPYDAASALEAYLRTFPVDMNASAPDRRDPVTYFLFDAKRGSATYHASAMTVMLRTLGIPARLASGYLLDPSRRKADGTFDLTQAQAFAWPEVFFPGAGWLEFNPTPSQPLVTRPTVAQTEVPPEPSLPVLASAATGVLAMPGVSEVEGLASSAPLAAWRWRDIELEALAVTAVCLCFGGLAAWELSVRRLGLAERLWEKTLRLASFAGNPLAPHETPRAYAARLARDVPSAGDAAYVASRYERVRFGNKELSADEVRRLHAAWASTRWALIRRIVHLSAQAPPKQDT